LKLTPEQLLETLGAMTGEQVFQMDVLLRRKLSADQLFELRKMALIEEGLTSDQLMEIDRLCEARVTPEMAVRVAESRNEKYSALDLHNMQKRLEEKMAAEVQSHVVEVIHFKDGTSAIESRQQVARYGKE